MAYRNKVYIAFDGDNDIDYYWLMKAWKNNENIDFDFFDAHDLTQSYDSSTTESIKASLRTRLNNSKLFILLIGEHTRRLTKFVQFEVEGAMRRNLPIICVNLNKSRYEDDLSPSWFGDYLRIYVPYGEKIIKYAMEHWPDSFKNHQEKGDVGSYYYKDSVYDSLEGE